VIEQCTQLIKHFMRGMGSDFIPVLEDYMKTILEGYKTIPIPSYIYAFEIIASAFNDDTTRPLIKLIFKEIVKLTLENYLVTDEDFDNVQLTEDFFGLFYRLLKVNPFIVFDSELFDDIVVFCIKKMDISHIDTCKNILYFLEKLVNFQELSKMRNVDQELLTVYYSKVKININNFGELLVSKIISFTVSVPPSMIYEHVKELIFSLAKNYPNECATWFDRQLKTSVPHDCLTNSEKEKIIQNMLNYSESNLDDLLDIFYRRCLARINRSIK
jgi:hypothetical protein